MEAVTPPLFERLPKDLFRPLAAENNHRYWDVLCRLMAEMWGEGGRSPGEEAPRPAVIRTIEAFLVADDPWDDLGSPVNIRAHGIYQVLLAAGWLSQRRRGVVEQVTVKPVIARFFTVLSEFAHSKPEFLAGKVRSIFVALREVASKNAPELYHEAAMQAKRCMAHITSTSCRIQDLMDVLVTKTTASEFVRGYFEEYIEKLFIADYSDFRTNNHPLQFRSQIIGLVLQFQHDAGMRAALINWYAEGGNDLMQAEALYERDTALLMRLRDVEKHLQRLDEEIRDAHQRAMAYFEYKLRSPGNFDKLIGRALIAVEGMEENHPDLPGASGNFHASEFGLARPRAAQRPQEPTPVEQCLPTTEELAMEALRQRMNAERNVTSTKLANYVARHLGQNTEVISDDFKIESINDLCCYQRLLLIASRDICPPAKRKDDPHLQLVPGMHVVFVPDAETKNEYMEHQQFVIYARKP